MGMSGSRASVRLQTELAGTWFSSRKNVKANFSLWMEAKQMGECVQEGWMFHHPQQLAMASNGSQL